MWNIFCLKPKGSDIRKMALCYVEKVYYWAIRYSYSSMFLKPNQIKTLESH